MPNGEQKFIEFSLCVIAAGADSGKVAELIKIGTGEGILSLRLPVEPRQVIDLPSISAALTLSVVLESDTFILLIAQKIPQD